MANDFENLAKSEYIGILNSLENFLSFESGGNKRNWGGDRCPCANVGPPLTAKQENKTLITEL